MKKLLPVAVAILILAQIAALWQIKHLQNQLDQTIAAMNNLQNSLSHEINSIYTNVDALLQEEASLLTSAAKEIGALNAADLTVPVTFTLTPKEVREATTVSLNFADRLFPMAKNGTTFTATVSCDIFGDALPLIIIEGNGVEQTIRDERINIINLKATVLPSLNPVLNSEASYNGATYQWTGSLSADIKQAMSGIEFTKFRLVIKVDDQMVSDTMIANKALANGYDIDETIPLGDGETCTMTLIAIDSLGLAHHYLIDYWLGDSSDTRRELRLDEEQIYSADGKLLWQPEYELVWE